MKSETIENFLSPLWPAGYAPRFAPMATDMTVAILCDAGDLTIAFSPDDDNERAGAEISFDALLGKGWLAFVARQEDEEPGQHVKSFAEAVATWKVMTDAEKSDAKGKLQILLTPPMSGGA